MRTALPSSAPSPIAALRSVATLLCVILLLPLASLALADDWSNKRLAPVKGAPGDEISDAREGGETLQDALIIASDPFEDVGATCDNENDLTPSCAYSFAPDVVYSFTPARDAFFTIDLCNSGYDTVLEVRDDQGTPIACNDDYCGLQSLIENLLLYEGRTYYIIVDGYGDACGSYALRFYSIVGPCVEWCDPIEGEPACHDEYVDEYNGGCNSEPPVFQPIWSDAQGMASMCGESGTYVYNGWSYRDTDWFQVIGMGTTVRASLHAEFDPQLLIFYETDCENQGYVIASGSCWYTIALEWPLESGATAWIWVGPSDFSGVSCGSRYLLEVTGIAGEPVPTAGTAWGGIKRLFR